jgi:type II secretory pathway predicted ATPase ExeA
MYLKHFGLAKRPFEQLPDPAFLFLSEKHETALANIAFAIGIQDGFVVVTGEIGSGKTTLLHKFLNENLADASVAYVTRTRLSDTELLQSILVEFGEKPFGKGKVELATMLKGYIEERHREGRRVVIVIDEAQNLTPGVLEELRLVTCVSPGTTKLVNVVLAGQPQFNGIIDSPELAQLKQRCRLRYHLKALTEEETRQYIEHRIAVAGGSFSTLFEPDLVQLIYKHCRGIPRLINMLCDTALIFACTDNSKMVSAHGIRQAVTELGWVELENQTPSAVDGADTPHSDLQGRSAVLIDMDSGDDYHLKDSVCIVGRAKNCSLQIKHPALSRYHMLIKNMGNEWVLSDMRSLNGVFLNGQRIRTARLRHNDCIAIGEHNFLFQVLSPDNRTDDGSAGGQPETRMDTQPVDSSIEL